eukprot:NODE_784_length_1179_cov_182.636283_g634_i0.p5 GENE.NODE_784_length_1179_cov_182.636283_g634_i0~~NODE_784_length_1179_cov_182.636283_g634_i0.p5  ORF type:complete len:91 (+),score=20.30 NODE_784_length_1179_cov_182.636283_g634_i0:44-316(+)
MEIMGVPRLNLQQADTPIAVATVEALTEVIRQSKATTNHGLLIELETAIKKLKEDVKRNSISLQAACELYKRYITRIGEQHERLVSQLVF